jgi:hypothetical protein
MAEREIITWLTARNRLEDAEETLSEMLSNAERLAKSLKDWPSVRPTDDSSKQYPGTTACRHRGGPLGEGDLMGTTMVCPWHGWEYDVTNGQSVDDPSVKVAWFAVRVDGDDILIEG